ncbi:unnamed protein product [Effrenium voratum]|nr:unnamed protein product [Effrenium voratum]
MAMVKRLLALRASFFQLMNLRMVLKSTPVKCDGYVDSYTTYENQYLTASKLIRGTAYKSMAAARAPRPELRGARGGGDWAEACLQKGHKCWGIFDDKCDGVNLMLADGDLNITTSGLTEGGMFRDSKQKSCIYQKKAPQAHALDSPPTSDLGYERWHGPTGRLGSPGFDKPGNMSPAFSTGGNPTFNSSRLALTLGAVNSNEPYQDPGLCWAESSCGLFTSLSPRPATKVPGCRAFLDTPEADHAEYLQNVKDFKHALTLRRGARRPQHGRRVVSARVPVPGRLRPMHPKARA